MLLFAFAGACALGGGYYFFAVENNAEKKIVNPKELVQRYQSRIQAILGDHAALNASVSRNPNAFACLSSVTADCTSKAGLFVLYPSQNALAISQLPNNAGISEDGDACNTYPSKDCPLHIEASWEPVCKAGGCVDTKSFQMSVAVRYDANDHAPVLDWKSDSVLVTPDVRLSAEVQCARSGGMLSGSSCVTGGSDRAIASSDNPNVVVPAQQAPNGMTPGDERLVCPQTIPVQGNNYPAQMSSPGKADVMIPAVNQCPNAVDTYNFMCRPNSSPTFENEGIWVQTGASLAPPCDENGHPLQEPTSSEAK